MFSQRTRFIFRSISRYARLSLSMTLPRILVVLFIMLLVGSLVAFFTKSSGVAQRIQALELSMFANKAPHTALSTKKYTEASVESVQSPPPAQTGPSLAPQPTVKPTPSSTPRPTLAPKPSPPPTPPTPAHFSMLGVGSTLPSETTCASQVRSAPETRPANATYNATKGSGVNSRYPRATGNFTGTTDEILQWVACKWGIDEDIVRAQAAWESYWFMRSLGDFTTNTSICAPGHQILGADGHPGQCPESVGLLQVRYQYYMPAFINNNAEVSTASNADATYAYLRDCYEGKLTWLGGSYVAGDMWGCVGVWFSGRWYDSPAVTYISHVKDWMSQRIWEQSSFRSAT